MAIWHTTKLEVVPMHRGKAALFTEDEAEDAVFDDNGEADADDAERMAACWNAFVGMTTADIVRNGRAAVLIGTGKKVGAEDIGGAE